MNIIKRLLKGQEGSALPLALILLAAGSTLTIPVLSGVASSMSTSRQADKNTSDGIAAIDPASTTPISRPPNPDGECGFNPKDDSTFWHHVQ